METLIFNSTLSVHIVAGIIALVTGLMAMLAKKKSGKFHSISGLTYYYAMAVIFITTIIFFVMGPLSMKYQFFLGIGVVSFYPVYTGKKVLAMKQKTEGSIFNKLLSVLGMVTGVIMLVYPIVNNHIHGSFSILFMVFGSILFMNGFGDFKVFFSLKNTKKNYWLIAHIGKMLGGYTATLTAFTVNAVPKYFIISCILAMWIVPRVILTTYSLFIRNKYKDKPRKTNSPSMLLA